MPRNPFRPPLPVDHTHKHAADTILGLTDSGSFNALLSGPAAPTADDGSVGDFWIDTTDIVLYGPKDEVNGWGDGTPIVGPAGPQGTAGSVGTSLTFKGAWVGGTAYSTNDWVTYQGSSYAAVAGSTGVTPGTDATKWAALAISGLQGDTGPQGETGDQGPEGPAGPAGPQGDPGVDGATGPTGVAGSAGAKGDTGATGAAGSAGAQGVQGPTGAKGDPGPTGPSLLSFRGAWSSSTAYQANDWVTQGGTSYFALQGSTNVTPGTDSTRWVLLTVNGPAGPTGATGAQGATGAAGAQGPAGPTGSAGATGPKGDAGATGPAGPTGAQGIAGPAGPSGSGHTITGRLVSGISSTATSFSVFGNNEWPTIPADVGSFNMMIDHEMMKVTAISTSILGIRNLVVVRHQQGTTATSHRALALCAIRPVLSGGSRLIEILIDASSTGSKGVVEVPINCQITGWKLLADAVGSCVVDVKKGTYAGYPTTTSIAASAKPTLSSARKGSSTTLTGWTVDLVQGDILEFNLDSVATITKVTLSLTLAQT